MRLVLADRSLRSYPEVQRNFLVSVYRETSGHYEEECVAWCISSEISRLNHQEYQRSYMVYL